MRIKMKFNTMKDPRFNKGIHDIKKTVMTVAEKRTIFDQIVGAETSAAKEINPYKIRGNIRSPWPVYSFGLWVTRHRVTSSIVAALLVIFVAGGGILNATGNSLPGDILYAFKTRFVEPTRLALANNPIAKARVQSDLAQTRLAEAETLAIDGKLSKSKVQEITTLLNEHTVALATSLRELKQAAPTAAEDISVGFQASMDAHAQVLDSIAADGSASSTASTTPNSPASDYTLATASANQTVASDSTIATLARASADEIGRDNIPPTIKAVALTKKVPPNPRGESTTPSTFSTMTAPTGTSNSSTGTVPPGYSTSQGAPAAPAPSASSSPSISPTPAMPASPSSTTEPSPMPTPEVTESTDESANARAIDNATTSVTEEMFTQKRAAVQSLITEASSTLSSLEVTSNRLKANLTIQGRVAFKLAQDLLKAADKQKSAGEINDAYTLLLKAEKSARQSLILIEARGKWSENEAALPSLALN
jgi:hypothetical protein